MKNDDQKNKSNKKTEKEIKEKDSEIENYKKKIEELSRKLEETEKIAKERLEQIKYLYADFENLRKQFEKEKNQIIELANENLIKELIVILDDFDAAINLSESQGNKEGLMTLKKKFFDILANHGLKEIEALGKKFDPNFHEVLCKEISEHEEDKIIEEIQKGYLLKSKVIRTSKVKVSKRKED